MHQMDLTEGVIWKKLILYAGPVVLSSLLQSAYSITDLIVAGWFIGKDGISAINNASQVMMILTQIIMGITTGGNILMGQYFGSKDRSNRVKTNRTMFGFALSAGALLSVLLFLLSRPILAALRAPALEEAAAYLQVCSAGLIAIFGYNALAAMLRSVGNSKQPFYCVAVTAGCNIALDCLFMGASDGAYGARPWPRCLPSGPALWSAWCMCCVTGTCLAWFGGRFLSTRIRWSRFSSWGFPARCR